MKKMQYLLIAFLVMPVFSSCIDTMVVDIINESKSPILVSSNQAKSAAGYNPRIAFNPIVFDNRTPESYLLTDSQGAKDDFFYFSTNRGIFSVIRGKNKGGVKDRWIVAQSFIYASKDKDQFKELAVYPDEQLKNFKKIIITIYQNTEATVQPKL